MSAYRSDINTLLFDAFYADEAGVKNELSNTQAQGFKQRKGFTKNRFTSFKSVASVVQETMRDFVAPNLANMANPAFNSGLKYKQTVAPKEIDKDKRDRWDVHVFFSDSVHAMSKQLADEAVWTSPLQVSILYGSELPELARNGLRTFFELQKNLQTLVVVPNREPGTARDDQDRWGVGIDESQLTARFEKYFRRKVPFEVVVLAGFSTGAFGLNLTIVNELVALDAVKRVVFYDCLYAQVGPKTIDALRYLKRHSNQQPLIIAYNTSGGPSANSVVSDTDQRLSLPQTFPLEFNANCIVENIRHSASLRALTCYRLLLQAAADNIIAIPKEIKRAGQIVPIFQKFVEMAKIVPERGSVVSREECYKQVHGSLRQDSVIFDKWATNPSNKKIIDSFAQLCNASDAWGVKSIWDNQLPGWAGVFGSEKHDLLLPEFAWEYLPG